MQFDTSKFQSTTTIDNNQFTINKLGAFEAFKMGTKLLKVVAPLIGGSVDGLRESNSFETPRTFTELALTLVDQLDKVELDHIVVQLLSGSTKNSIEIKDLNDKNILNLNELVELFAFALKENFGELFTGKGIAAQLKGMLMSMTEDGVEESQEQ